MRPPVEHLGVRLHPWTMEETAAFVERALDEGRLVRHASVNVAKLVRLRSDPDLRRDVESCDVVTADGQGVVWGAALTGVTLPERVAGIDLFRRMLELAARRGEPVFLLGAREHVLDRAVATLRNEFPALDVAGTHHGYFGADEAPVWEAIRRSGATMLFVGMDTPRKERVVAQAGPEHGLSFAMGVGGAFDVVAGERRRAPATWQRAGLEWAYRLAQDPRRLGRRYLVTNTVYAALLARERIRRR